MTFDVDGNHYGPAGRMHAVDIASAVNRPDALVGYSVCGEAVLSGPTRASIQTRPRRTPNAQAADADGDGDGDA